MHSACFLRREAVGRGILRKSQLNPIEGVNPRYAARVAEYTPYFAKTDEL